MCSVRLVLLVSATDEQQLLERETPNPTLSAAITHTRSVSHLSGAVSRDTSESHVLVEVAASCFLAPEAVQGPIFRSVEPVLISHGCCPSQRVVVEDTIRLWYSDRGTHGQTGLRRDWGPRNPVLQGDSAWT